MATHRKESSCILSNVPNICEPKQGSNFLFHKTPLIPPCATFYRIANNFFFIVIYIRPCQLFQVLVSTRLSHKSFRSDYELQELKTNCQQALNLLGSSSVERNCTLLWLCSSRCCLKVDESSLPNLLIIN